MIRLQRILLATDFSPNARPALEYACSFAEAFGSELHLLFVVQDLSYPHVESMGVVTPPATNIEDVRASAERLIQTLPDPAWCTGRKVVRTVRVGTPFIEIVRHARELPADMLVLGTHGWTGLAHLMLGSVAERVVRKAPCPVLTVRPVDFKFVHP